MNTAYTDLADALFTLALRMRHLASVAHDLPEPHVQLNIQPGGYPRSEHTGARVDKVTTTLLGIPAETVPISGGTFHRLGAGHVGPLEVRVFGRVDPPATAPSSAQAAWEADVRAAEANGGEPS